MGMVKTAAKIEEFSTWQDGAYDRATNEMEGYSRNGVSIFRSQNKASNEILWKYHDSTSWDAILNSQKETTEYHMQAYDPFSK